MNSMMTPRTSNGRSVGIAQTPRPPEPPFRFDPTPMVVTSLVFVLALLFLCFFSAVTRRLFSARRNRRPPPPPPPPDRRAFRPSAAAAGLDAAAVRALPVLTYAWGEGKDKEEAAAAKCVVCLGEFEVGARVKVIPRCGHGFHPECIDAWLVGRGSCPVCRCAEMGSVGAGVDVGLSGEFCVVVDVEEEEEVVGEQVGEGDEERVGLGRSRSCGCGPHGGEKRRVSSSSLRRCCSESEIGKT